MVIYYNINYKLNGTDLQNKIWESLSGISFGSTATYSEIASIIGKPKAFRYVATTIGKNPLTIILPCHRIIGSDGKLRGYASGLKIKKKLLDHEEDSTAYISKLNNK